MLHPAAVGLLTLTRQALETGDVEAHNRLTGWIEDLDPLSLQDVVWTLLLLTYDAAEETPRNVDDWLRRLGMELADG